MAEYSITVELLKSTLVNMTAAQIVAAINASSEVIDADNVAGGGGGGYDTPTEVVNAINSLGGASPAISYGQVTTIPKSRILHAEKCLNRIYEGDPRSSAFQALYSAPNTDRIKTGDYIYVSAVNQSEAFANGDWVIARVDSPTWSYTDTSQWLILKLSLLDNVSEQVFRRHSDTTTGVESILGSCAANGSHSFAPGEGTVANGEASTSLGKESKASRIGEVAISGGKRSLAGDRQRSFFHMFLTTTNAAETEMVLPSRFAFDANKTYLIELVIVGVVQGGKKAASYYYKYLAGTDSDGYVPVYGGIIDPGFQSDTARMQFGTPNFSVSVNVTDYDAQGPPPPGIFKGLQIFCTGLANTTVYWNAYFTVYEVGNL